MLSIKQQRWMDADSIVHFLTSLPVGYSWTCEAYLLFTSHSIYKSFLLAVVTHKKITQKRKSTTCLQGLITASTLLLRLLTIIMVKRGWISEDRMSINENINLTGKGDFCHCHVLQHTNLYRAEAGVPPFWDSQKAWRTSKRVKQQEKHVPFLSTAPFEPRPKPRRIPNCSTSNLPIPPSVSLRYHT